MTDAPRNRPLAPGRHVRRPLLLALVYGVFLMVILRGRRAHASTAFTSAAAGDPAAGCSPQTSLRRRSASSSTGPLLREYLPIIFDGDGDGDGDGDVVVGIWRDATPILGRLEATRGDVLLVTAVGGLLQ